MTPPRSAASATMHLGWRRWMPGAVACLLSACGGGVDGDAPSPPATPVTTLTATVHHGVADTALPASMTVKGVAGLFRVAQPTPQATFVAKLEQLTGPYAVGLSVYVGTESSPRVLGSLALGPGALNVTPLTTLAMAQLTGQDPSLFFPKLGGTGDAALTAVSADAMAVAQTEVRRYLTQQYDFTVPQTVGDFFTGPFSPQAGDPMYDAITALNQRLAQRGTHAFAVAERVAQHARYCHAERLTLTLAGTSLDFCPAQKITRSDAVDGSLLHHRFIGDFGDLLTVSVRGDLVVETSLLRSSGTTYACQGPACAGLSMGRTGADGSRRITWTSVPLSGGTGRIAVDGSLLASPPGTALPPLPCSTDRYTIAYPDDRVDATCAAPDGAIGAGIGDTSPAGASRRVHQFQTDGSVDPAPAKLEVRTDPLGLRSVLVQDLDPDTGAVRTVFRCQGTGCNGAQLGPVRDDVDSFPPYTLRRRLIRLDDTVLSAFHPDGTPATVGAATVRAELDSFEIIFPPEGQAHAAACASPSQRLTVQLSDEPAASVICPPTAVPPGLGFGPEVFRTTRLVDGGALQFLLASYYSSELASGSPPYDGLGGVTITVDGATVTEVVFKSYDGSLYRCRAGGCSGLTVAPPDAQGERAITLDGLVLSEIETAGLPGDRSATVSGRFTAPALP